MRKDKDRQLKKVLKKYNNCLVTSRFLAKAIMKNDKRDFINGQAVGQLLRKYNFKKFGAKTEPKKYLISV